MSANAAAVPDQPRPHGALAARAAANAVRERLGVRNPVTAIVLGSGLDGLADRIENARRVPYADVPGLHATRVPGHRGEIIVGTLGGREVVALAGRFHMYEGFSARTAAFPVRLVHALGARVLFLSNAAGGIRSTLAPGSLMMIEDHINLTFRNPLVGPVEPGDTRFPDMSRPYSPRLNALLVESARAAGVTLSSGVYAGLLGPAYETPAEVRLLAMCGADAVGMSTVVETIVGVAIGMEVAGVSVITNAAAGLGESLSHEDVVRRGLAVAGEFGALVEGFVRRVGGG
ncbi:MAG TPA: purine-nucleoside phosphorylase [Gemmatimonadaceae bacterium]|nr:purine-nucleoside phosphorylase [Gemmatimonadaceae bacterium]